ncbi:MAG: hypothetical protein WCS52_13760 [bacterium]
MTGFELVELFRQGSRRCHVIGSLENGVVAGLDLEGRLFAVLNGEVVNKVNPEAILGVTDGEKYLNPGGDGLWPAPEGTALGYEYASGKWRVPPGLTGAKYKVVEAGENFARIRAEVDLINDRGLGIPTVFERAVTVIFPESSCLSCASMLNPSLTVRVTESIQYIGSVTLEKGHFSLAPWTLCQFDSGMGTEVTFNDVSASSFWDLYASSHEKQYQQGGVWHTKTDGGIRYQLGMNKDVSWLEFTNPTKKLRVRRTVGPLSDGHKYIDISDVSPDRMPSEKGVKFSVYSDPGLFMEIEACGGCPETLISGCLMSVSVETTYSSLSLT